MPSSSAFATGYVPPEPKDRQCWVIAPFESKPADLYEKVWQFDLANNLISIGWVKLGDVSNMDRGALRELIASTYPEKAHGLIANMMWEFYHKIRPGDLVIARRGRKNIAAVGTVTRPAFYAPGKNPSCSHPNFLEVTWHDNPRNKSFLETVFPMHTLADIPEERFQELVVPPVINRRDEFVLEKYLEEFIVSNFDSIFKRELSMYEDADGNDGQQYETDIGTIDILAVERTSKSFVVIELKRDRTSDHVIGQTLRYMGWVKKNLCCDGQDVKGLIICQDSDPRLSYALEMTDNIEVRYYTVSFKLAETSESHVGVH